MVFWNSKIPKFVAKNFNTSDPIFEELPGEGLGKIDANERKYFLGIFISACWFEWLLSCIKNFGGMVLCGCFHFFLEIQDLIDLTEFQNSLSDDINFGFDFLRRTPFDSTTLEGTFLGSGIIFSYW